MSEYAQQEKNKVMQLSIGASVLVHLLFILPFGWYGGYRFAKPVDPLQAVMVDLARFEPDHVVTPRISRPLPKPTQEPPAAATRKAATPAAASAAPKPPGATPPKHLETSALQPEAKVSSKEAEGPSEVLAGTPVVAKTKAPILLPPPLRRPGEFLGTTWERLIYRVSMLGLPIGEAVLEAKNERGEVKISLSVKSRPPFSGIYPVDDLIETRHAAGNFIITKIRQQEGTFRSNRGFTLFLRDKKVFWMDLLTQRSLNETVPTSEVLDLLSALYYLRNRPLKVGSAETLHVYDSDAYSELPVQILRREEVDLPGLKSVRTLVVKPLLSTGGIFKRTGDITIWLTDDAYKAPVRVQTEIALGKITADLVSAESKDEMKETGKAAVIKQPAGTHLESKATAVGD